MHSHSCRFASIFLSSYLFSGIWFLSDKNRSIIHLNSDGNCLFRAISDQLYHDYGAKHYETRADIVDYLQAHQTHFESFVVTDDDDTDENEGARSYPDYISRMKQDGTWGGNLELVAAAMLYKYVVSLFACPCDCAMSFLTIFTQRIRCSSSCVCGRRRIILFSADLNALNFDPMTDKGGKCVLSGPNLLLSYHDNEHYNSIRDTSIKFISFERSVYVKHSSSISTNIDTVDALSDKDDVAIDDNLDGEVEVSVVPEDGRDSLGSIDDRDIEARVGPTRDPVEQQMSPTTTGKQTPTNNRITNNALCPCGTGLRYKRCCRIKEKQAARLQSRGQTAVEKSTMDNARCSPVEHKFRVLTI
jgi:hypothetical protein